MSVKAKLPPTVGVPVMMMNGLPGVKTKSRPSGRAPALTVTLLTVLVLEMSMLALKDWRMHTLPASGPRQMRSNLAWLQA
jgi:hypothetical protein